MLRKFYILLISLTLMLAPWQVSQAEEEEGEAAPPQAIYVPLEPDFVVNVQDPRRKRFMKLSIQLMTYDPAVATAVEENMPAVRHALVMLLTHQSAADMNDIAKRDAVREEARSRLQQVLSETAGVAEGLDAVYFTNFVIQ